MKMKKTLPLPDRPFWEIRQDDFLYADKTEYIYRILNVDKYKTCFLSRPRRFGKTLLLSTIAALFTRERDLFEGLWISNSDYKFEKHPVLNFNMGFSKTGTPEELITRINDTLTMMADTHGIRLKSNAYGEMLGELLAGLHGKHGKHGQGAVILVDEYDAPVIDHISDRDLALENRNVLHNFYRSMKANICYIHLAFVTGITGFVMSSLDSGPNNLWDISLKPEYAGICGFTPGELVTCFEDRFPETIRSLQDQGVLGQNDDFEELIALIKKYYDGYNWLGSENVLNPYSILCFFEQQKLGSYWPKTGRPSHLTALVRENPLDFILPQLDGYPIDEVLISDITNLSAIPVLFHSGYLTIDRQRVMMTKSNGFEMTDDVLSFRFPNREVAIAYNKTIFKDVFKPNRNYLSNMTKELPNALAQKDSDAVEKLLRNLLTSISYLEHPTASQLAPYETFAESWQNPASEKYAVSEEPNSTERYYHAILHGSFLSAGFDVHSQGAGAHGRNDIALFLNDKFRVVIELKYCALRMLTDKGGKSGNESKMKERLEKVIEEALDRAENQMRRKDYAGPYRAAGCRVTCMAVAIWDRDKVAVRFLEN
ncbi:MAG: ATP-binding protein [Deltaproteobacteria bacterium]|jgi:hypothetical protein|nr:ATP-binding protein [Deltaproteobacteria bacterium]